MAMDLPSSWNGFLVEEMPLSSFGYATYQLRLLLPNESDLLAIAVPEIGTAFRLYVDTRLVAEAGTLSTTKEGFRPQYSRQVVSLHTHSDTLLLTLQVANFSHNWGGVWYPLYMGEVESVYNINISEYNQGVFLVGAFFIISIYNLIQFLLRMRDFFPAYLGMLCLFVSLREMVNLGFYANLPFIFVVKIDYLSFCLITIFFLLAANAAFPREFRGLLHRVVIWLSALYAAYILLAPPHWFSSLLYYYHPLLLLWLVTTPLYLYKAIRNKRQGAKTFSVAMAIVFVTFINDMLYARELIFTRELYSFGMLGLIICQGVMLLSRFSFALNENVKLAKNLSIKNTELQSFSRRLEKMVDERTEELAAANKKLENIAHTDYLTGLSNRRQAMTKINMLFKNAKENISLIMIDVDHFKAINDDYGHDVGDSILVWLAGKLASITRGSDIVSRWGGEEFIIVLKNTDISGALVVSNNIQRQLAEAPPEGSPLSRPVTVTIGIGTRGPAETFEQLFSRVDESLLAGKRQGRDCILVAEAE